MSALQALVDMVKEAKAFKRNKTPLEGAGEMLCLYGKVAGLVGGMPGRAAFMKGLPKPETS